MEAVGDNITLRAELQVIAKTKYRLGERKEENVPRVPRAIMGQILHHGRPSSCFPQQKEPPCALTCEASISTRLYPEGKRNTYCSLGRCLLCTQVPALMGLQQTHACYGFSVYACHDLYDSGLGLTGIIRRAGTCQKGWDWVGYALRWRCTRSLETQWV